MAGENLTVEALSPNANDPFSFMTGKRHFALVREGVSPTMVSYAMFDESDNLVFNIQEGIQAFSTARNINIIDPATGAVVMNAVTPPKSMCDFAQQQVRRYDTIAAGGVRAGGTEGVFNIHTPGDMVVFNQQGQPVGKIAGKNYNRAQGTREYAIEINGLGEVGSIEGNALRPTLILKPEVDNVLAANLVCGLLLQYVLREVDRHAVGIM